MGNRCEDENTCRDDLIWAEIVVDGQNGEARKQHKHESRQVGDQ